MSKIKVFLTEVDAMAPKIGIQKSHVDQVESIISSARRSLDPKILGRKNISGQFSTIQKELQEVDKDLTQIKTFITTAVDKYENAEKKIKRAANQVGKPKDKSLAQIIKKLLNFNPNDPRVKMLIRMIETIQRMTGKGSSSKNGADIKDDEALISTNDLIKSIILNTAVRLPTKNSAFYEKNGLKFEVRRDSNGNIIIREMNNRLPVSNSSAYNSLRQKLSAELGQNSTEFGRRFTNRLVSGAGIPLYVGKNVKSILGMNFAGRKGIAENLKKFRDGATNFFDDFPALQKTPLSLKTVSKTLAKNTKDAFKGIVDDFNFKGALTKGEKWSKKVGIVGTALDFWDNKKVFTDDEYKDKSTAQKTTRYVTHTAIDLAAGAGSAAVGGTVGSFFLPPVGTVIGIGVGIGVDAVLDAKFLKDENGKKISVKDFAKDKADDLVDAIEDSKVYKGVKNFFSKKISSFCW